MPWNILTSEDLQNKLTAAEFSAITQASLPDGKTSADVVAEEIANVTQEVRGYVAGYAPNVLGDGATVPDELRDVALVILRHRTFTRLPNMKRLLDELRVKEYEEAMRKLRDVAVGRFRVVNPETPAAQQASGGGVQVVSKTKRRATRKGLSGLF